jgi:hypothetical protein
MIPSNITDTIGVGHRVRNGMVNPVARKKDGEATKHRAVGNPVESRVVEAPKTDVRPVCRATVPSSRSQIALRPTTQPAYADVTVRVNPATNNGRDRSESRDRVRADSPPDQQIDHRREHALEARPG